MMGQGDLGFIGARNNSYMGSKLFMGGTSNPSKKGPFGPGGLSKLSNNPALASEILQPEAGSEPMLQKRTEWLEQQERKLSATMSETRTSTQDLASQVAMNKQAVKEMKEFTQQMNVENQKQSERAQTLFNETQWVYGFSSTDLMGFPIGKDSMKTLGKYRNKDEMNMSIISKKGTWNLLIYPMERVDISPTHFQYLMRCKTVNKQTGQLSVSWVTVYESKDDDEVRHIKEFSVTKS